MEFNEIGSLNNVIKVIEDEFGIVVYIDLEEIFYVLILIIFSNFLWSDIYLFYILIFF